MGLIRLLLALSVVIAHTGNSFKILSNGSDCVQLFFIISGFYMFLILDKKYYKLSNSYYYFITNRVLRIFPMYFVILFLAISYALYSSKFSPRLPNDLAAYVAFWDKLDIKYLVLFVVSNLTIIGQEILSFFNYAPTGSGLIFKPEGDNILSQFIFIPQAWSIGMEFWFYLLAPFFFKLKNNQIVIIIIFLIILKYLFINGFSNSYNWKYRVHFFELGYFFLGGISYKLIKIKKFNPLIGKAILMMIIVYVASINLFTDNLIIKWGTYLVFSLAIPVIFRLTSKSKTDKFLGDLSYPIYIIHFLIIAVSREFNITSVELRLVFIILLSILISYILNKILNPIEKYRKVRLSNKVN
jgi:peptidoglycan/LPS O-acetylase OafA/YrhL